MKNLDKNIVANYIGTAFKSGALLLSIPFYLKFLGGESWGLVAALLTLYAMTNLLGSGMAQVLPREIAMRGNSANRGDIALGFERIYWVLGSVISLSIFLLSDFIVISWFSIDETGQTAAIAALKLFSLQIFFQWPFACYEALLLGCLDHLILNKIRIIFSIFRYFGCVLILWIVDASVQSFILWNIIVSLIETSSSRYYSVQKIGSFKGSKWNALEMQGVLRFSVGISLTAVMGTIIVQLDKLVLVSMTDLEEFGFYSICSAAGLALLQLVYPITRSAYPEGAKLLAAGKSLSELNERVLVMISILVLPVGVVLCVFSQEILYLWTQNINLINFGSVILRILVLGTLLNVYYNLPYMNWLLCGEYKRPLLTNFVAMLVVLVCIVPLIKVFGAEGAALCWVIANLFCLFIGWLWMIRNGHFSLEKCINAMLVAIGYFSIALAVKYMISSYLAIFITLVIFLILGYSLAKYSLLRRKNISRN